MREAVGGALLIKLLMFFIVIYVCFMAIAVNYSITFRVKNQIINLIEAYEGYDLAEEHIKEYVASVGYYKANGNMMVEEDCINAASVGGYCIEELTSTRGTYYKVTTYVSFDFPIVGRLTNFPVSGETKVIYSM